MSLDGQLFGEPPGAVLVGDFSMPQGTWFDWHQHPDHQLAWAASGVALVRISSGRTWVLPSGRALWIPAGVEHTTGASVATKLNSLYLTPQRCPQNWSEPTVIAVPGLLRELIGYLGGGAELPVAARLRAEAVLFDLITPVPTTALEVPAPTDQRLLLITGALRNDPADGRTLGEWGQLVGASARNLARLFVAETGMTFGQWRQQARLLRALELLATGEKVIAVALALGYDSPSAFAAMFKRQFGEPPTAFFR